MPFFAGWSQEVIVPYTVTEFQELIPLISAAASSKDDIESYIMLLGVLSGFNDKIDKTIRIEIRPPLQIEQTKSMRSGQKL